MDSNNRHHILYHHKYFFQDKHREHHSEYPPKNYQNSEHGPNVNLPWWAGAIVVGLLTLPGFLVSYFTGYWAIVYVVAATSTFYFLAYNYVHTCYHVPNGKRWFEKTKLYKRMDRYHHVHHARDEEYERLINICVLCPLADWVMGTSFRH